MQHQIATVINYCTNDYRFLDECIKRVRQFSSEIIIPVADHFFDGTPENEELLLRSYFEHPDVTFVQYRFDAKKPYGLKPGVENENDWTHYWHSTSRYIGFQRVSDDIEYILFLDADEICETERFIDYLEAMPYRLYSAIRFRSFNYFLRPEYRANDLWGFTLFVRKDDLDGQTLLTPLERKGTFLDIKGSKLDNATGIDSHPLFHHYGWVRSKPELYKKVAMWGHKHDVDWKDRLDRLFSEPFDGTFHDPVLHQTYTQIESPFNPLAIDADLLRTRTLYSNYTPEQFHNVKLIE
ncbi:MAG: hypothetical protein P0S94_00820 [Simkaniaceae bacterium]|nr:hypothetical protein [Simkaniaceae bacterium]